MLPTGRDLSLPHGELELRVRCHDRERLDVYLLKRLGWKSRRRVQRLIQIGRVVVDGRPAKPSQRIQRGARIHVTLDPGGASSETGDEKLMPFWEDPYLLALDKPPGVLVHPVGRTVSGTIINELHHRYRALNRRGSRPVVPRLCHRLDRDTSGVLLVAKTGIARCRLQDAFEADRVAKEYLAVVEGQPTSQVIDLPITAHLDPQGASQNRLSRVAEDGKPSVTEVEVVATAAALAVVRCRPRTGRQNQIRAHLAAIGHPILGDTGYGSFRERWSTRGGDEVPDIPFPNRALLHSARLEFPHPIWPARAVLAAPPAADFAPFLALTGVHI